MNEVSRSARTVFLSAQSRSSLMLLCRAGTRGRGRLTKRWCSSRYVPSSLRKERRDGSREAGQRDSSNVCNAATASFD